MVAELKLDNGRSPQKCGALLKPCCVQKQCLSDVVAEESVAVSRRLSRRVICSSAQNFQSVQLSGASVPHSFSRKYVSLAHFRGGRAEATQAGECDHLSARHQSVPEGSGACVQGRLTSAGLLLLLVFLSSCDVQN